MLAIGVTPAGSQTYPYQEAFWKDARIGLHIPGVLDDTVTVTGPALLAWSDPFVSGPYVITESRLLAMDLEGRELPMLVRVDAGGPFSPGLARGTPPDPMPAESFFDLFLEIELPTLLPGVVLTNSVPIHASAAIAQFPPYFHPYATTPGAAVPLVDQLAEPRGEVRLWSETAIPWSPPEAAIRVETRYGTDEAELDSLGRVAVSGFVSGPDDALQATFSWRPDLPGIPWMEYAVDADGSHWGASTFFDSGSGDGWTGCFDPAPVGPPGAYVDFKVEFQMPSGPMLSDSLRCWVTSAPPQIELPSCPPEELLGGRPDEIIRTLARILGTPSVVVTFKKFVFPIPISKQRPLEPVDQLTLSDSETELDLWSCGPAAMASCLKYFAKNGHPQLEHPGGDLAKPEQTGRDIARELRGDMGTNTTVGTDDAGMTKGVERYLERHGQTGWTTAYEEVKNYSDVAGMLREFEADGEDVMMLLEDAPGGTGNPKSHWVTLGSRGSRIYNVVTETYDAMCIEYKLDFMDPNGGGPTSENEYNIGTDAQGRPTVTNYEGFRPNGVPPARIKGFVKVSPPAAGGSGTAFPTAGIDLSPGWVLVDEVPASGSGLVDTLTWDTNGFARGTYLVMVVATEASGREHSVIRLGGISEYTLDAPGPGPARTGLRGAQPNPTRSGAVIEFALLEGGPVDLTVHDVRGRVVRRLLAGVAYPGGTHKVAWDGLGAGGVPVGSGVYFCRFRAAGVEEEGKIVVVR